MACSGTGLLATMDGSTTTLNHFATMAPTSAASAADLVMTLGTMPSTRDAMPGRKVRLRAVQEAASVAATADISDAAICSCQSTNAAATTPSTKIWNTPEWAALDSQPEAINSPDESAATPAVDSPAATERRTARSRKWAATPVPAPQEIHPVATSRIGSVQQQSAMDASVRSAVAPEISRA